MRRSKKSPNEMTFLEHLGELRKRIFYSFLAVGGGVIPGWILSKPLYNILARPLTQASVPRLQALMDQMAALDGPSPVAIPSRSEASDV